ncbi:DUF58 domain-containing protein [Kordiimonas aestuarii]|uniref:DUF58 domain-containing protein n=1 Tax=Kordiimonas aestuarii TaxID=1005925 RepID=UPI0021D0F85C|nr:DUF58 domain-containing protein [Kordiimonas aestuarii]
MERLIDPKTLARVKDMPLIAKTVADGFLHGLHQSRQRGVGIEFSQYRSYEDGDELGRIDWKLFARSDKYFVREAERESEIAVWFVLDTSASMQVGSASETKQPHWSKLDYAAHLIATLSYLAFRQGDRIGFMALSADKQHVVPLGSGEQHWSAILLELARLKAGFFFPPLAQISKIIHPLQSAGLLFVISDFYQRRDELNDLLQALAVGRTEVAAIQLTTKDEAEFPYKGVVRFEDAETGEQILISAKGACEAYQKRWVQFQTELQQYTSALSIPLSCINIDNPMDQAIYDFLDSRRKVIR